MTHRKVWPRIVIPALLVTLLSCPVATRSSITAAYDSTTPPGPAPSSTPTWPSVRSTISRSATHLEDDPDWSSGGPTGVNVRTVAVHPITPSVVFAGGDDGVYRTLDSGITWQAVMTGTSVVALGVDPLAPDRVWAGGWEGVYRSTDGGDGWEARNEGLPTGPTVQAFAFDPDTPGIVYVGTMQYGVFRSTDGGSNWTPSNTGLPAEVDVYALAVDPGSADTVYAATAKGVFKSTDGAESWAAANTGLHAGVFRSLVVDPDRSGTVYAASLYSSYYAGVYRSTNGGASWELARSGIVGADARALTIASGVLFVTTDGGVFRSVDGGERWRGIYPGRPSSAQIRALAVSGGDPQTVYVGVESDEAADRGVWQTTLASPPPVSLSPAHPPKAVLIVGPLDGPTHEDTQAAIEAMENRASWLESHGLEVVRLYHPNATWEDLRGNLSGASIVLYAGHGFGYDPDDVNYLSTGGANNGFCLTDPEDPSGGTLATQDMLIAYSQLAQNAVVMVFACYSAGSSATDTTAVPEDVARRRVNDYAYTFLTIGAEAYFAGGDWGYYLERLFTSLDDTTGAAYQTAPGYDPAALRAYAHTQYPDDCLWLDPAVSSTGEVLGWGSAFSGDPDLPGRTILGRADFAAMPTSGPAPLTVDFTNTTTGDYEESLWDFGDGMTSTQESPTHAYTAPGVYTVTLTVVGPRGTDVATRPEHIAVHSGARIFLPCALHRRTDG